MRMYVRTKLNLTWMHYCHLGAWIFWRA